MLEDCPSVVIGYRGAVRVTCENCGAALEIWREPIVQLDREADNVGPAVHVITGDGWALHTCHLVEHERR